VSDDGFAAPLGSPVPLQARVLAQDGLGVPGVPVTFVSTQGGGSTADEVVISDASGFAGTTGILGQVAGPQVFEARVEGLAPAVFSFTAAPLPAIALNPTSVSMTLPEAGAEPASRTVSVTNEGDGVLDGLQATVAYGPGQPTGWLLATLDRSVAPATLTITASAATLGQGSYSAAVEVSSAAANNSPQTVTVSLTVVASPPLIELSRTSVSWSLSSDPPWPSRSVSITNSGGGSLGGLDVDIVYPSDTPEWLRSALSLTTAPATLTLTPQPIDYITGEFTAEVIVRSPDAANSPQVIAATLELFNPPTISSPGFNLLVLNDAVGCAGQSPPGSRYRVYFDYWDPDDDIPVRFGEVAELYGEPIRMAYQFKPAGNSGSTRLNGEVDGDTSFGTAWFEPCIQFGPAENISVALTISLYDLGNHRSNAVTINILRPVGANAPPAGAPSQVGAGH
jgi:hypothetical protein